MGAPKPNQLLLHPEPETDAALHITQRLQTTLSLNGLLQLFYEAVSQWIPLGGMEYIDDRGQPAAKFGERARHIASYDLTLEEIPLGQLSFRRRRSFSGEEIRQLENLLCSLLYPLRNALLYRDALSLAQKDPLTGICNRAALDEALRSEVSLSERHGTPLALIILDIDHFKSINDSYGHSRGDCAIKQVVEAAQRCARSSDSLFRYGGEEFVLLLRNTAQKGAHLLADRIRRRVQNMECICDGERIELTISAGVAALHQGQSAETLFERADSALYAAKTGGRNQVVSADD
ncbi:GGDEF domain-containing protein [Thiohalobacter sp. IOR34]|uniref:GGDEF domain-containing protein n=1 Tax=Thiohalobacter sp. IOR34 TaxID=3057176 RepID=UPI0025B24974|nr:GGDEF domain-containing protein [Thiohalobacter sp. IOR34]WJW76652.1 GGDEF domain-containing protein [Thiohalobacter sp. IOR34]